MTTLQEKRQLESAEHDRLRKTGEAVSMTEGVGVDDAEGFCEELEVSQWIETHYPTPARIACVTPCVGRVYRLVAKKLRVTSHVNAVVTYTFEAVENESG